MNVLPVQGSIKFVSEIDYEQSPKSESLSILIYGVTVQKLNHKGKAKTVRFYLHEYNKKILTWVSKQNLKPSKIDLTKLTKIELLGASKGFSKYKPLLNKKTAVTLNFHHKELELIFANETELKLWISGIHYILYDIGFSYNKSNTVDDFTVHVWAHTDSYKTGNLSFKEIKTMLKSLNIFANKEEIQIFFQLLFYIDFVLSLYLFIIPFEIIPLYPVIVFYLM